MPIYLAKTRLAVSITCGLLLLSDCAPKKKGEKEASSLAASTQSADKTLLSGPFSLPPKLSSFDQQGVVDIMADYEANFVANSPESSPDAESEVSLCYQRKLDALEIQANDTTVKVGGLIDLSECFKAAFEVSGSSLDFIRTTVMLKYEGYCSAGGLAIFQGKRFSEAGRLKFTCTSGISRDFASSMSKSAFKARSGDRTVEVESQSESYQGMEDGNPCEQEVQGDLWVKKDGCVAIERLTYTKYLLDGVLDNDGKRDTFFKASSLGVTRKNDDTSLWYVDGNYKVQLNDWIGIVSNRGADQAPTYELTRDGVVAKGDLNHAESQFSLFQQQNITQQLKQLKDIQLHLKSDQR